MWFVWSLITFLIVIFSSSQIASYLVCFMRYPEMMEDMSDSNKKLVICGVTLHSCINILWLILVCVVPAIREYWVAILVVAVICLMIGIYNVRKDPHLKQNFAELTGYSKRKRIEKELNQVVDNYKKIISANSHLVNYCDNSECNEDKTETDSYSDLEKAVLENIETWEPTYEDAVYYAESRKEHTVDKIPYYVKKVKDDSKYFKDICEILIQMYSKDNQVFLAIDKVILCVEYLSEKYLIVFTEKQYVADRYKNKEKELGVRDTFALFYELNEKNLCKGIILNPFTEIQTILTKDSLDSLHLELMFDFPWKKKK